VIPLCYDRTDVPLYRGGYADLWRGKHNGLEVAAKVLRVYSTSGSKAIRKVGYPQPAVCINELTMSCTAVLQGGCNVEIPSSSERVATVRCDGDWESARDGIRVDEEREHQRVCEGAS
jgi:hypothetical protein